MNVPNSSDNIETESDQDIVSDEHLKLAVHIGGLDTEVQHLQINVPRYPPPSQVSSYHPQVSDDELQVSSHHTQSFVRKKYYSDQLTQQLEI